MEFRWASVTLSPTPPTQTQTHRNLFHGTHPMMYATIFFVSLECLICATLAIYIKALVIHTKRKFRNGFLFGPGQGRL